MCVCGVKSNKENLCALLEVACVLQHGACNLLDGGCGFAVVQVFVLLKNRNEALLCVCVGEKVLEKKEI